MFFDKKPKINNIVDQDELLAENISLKKQLTLVTENSSDIAGILDLDKVLELILHKLVNQLGYGFSAIQLFDKDNKYISIGKLSIAGAFDKLLKMSSGTDLFNIKLYVDNPEHRENYQLKAVLTKQLLITENMYDFTRPIIGETQSKIIQNVIRLKRIIAIPLIANDVPIGTLSVSSQRIELAETDTSLLSTFANQIAVAIYNARLFAQVRSQVTQLEIQNHDLSSLYNLTSQISKSLDPEEVAQTAVNSLPQDKIMIGAILSSYDQETGKSYVNSLTENQLSYQVKKVIGDFSQYSISVNDEKYKNSPVTRAIKFDAMQQTNQLSDFLSPPIPKNLANIIEGILQIKSLITYPVKVRGKLTGTITYLLKDKLVDQLQDNDKQLLETYTNQIKIALENASLFKQEQIIQKNLEEALTELKERRKFEQDMIDVMGHELRTPMSILRNAVSMMDLEIRTKGAIQEDHQKKYVDVAMDAARREIRLIETLLSATKTDAKGFQLLMQNVDLTSVIDSALLANKNEATKKGIEIKYAPPEVPVVVYGDQLRIQEVADNFLNNAVKYTEKGTIEIKIYNEDNRGWISIKDSGVGISEEDQKKLGQKFFRASWFEGRADRSAEEVTKDAAGAHIKPSGTGLGLYVSFNLIKIQDGSFKIDSKIREGSTFSFGIPLYTNQPLQQVQKATQEVFEGKEAETQKV